MGELTEINLVVSDLEASHRFYLALGCAMRPIVFTEGEEPRAWMATGGPLPVSVHTPEFAAWWDATAPAPAGGATTIDVTVDTEDEATALVEAARTTGGTVLAELRQMDWGQHYAIIADPDGYRWGVKYPPR